MITKVLLWSVVLVPGRTAGAWNDAARAYYTRETVRQRSDAFGARFDLTRFDDARLTLRRLLSVTRRWSDGDGSARDGTRWIDTDGRERGILNAQVNLSSAYGASVRVPIPAIDLRSLALAWRQESSWQQKALSVVSTALLPSKAQQTKQSLQARLRHLDEQLLIGGTAESGASEAAAANAKVFSLSF